MPNLWNDLLDCLELTPVAAPTDGGPTGLGEALVFEGQNQKLEYHRVFGGQILGQIIQAARLTCPDKVVKSLHTVFPREGRADEPIRYAVTLHHQGRSFASLSVTATQSTGVVGSSTVSMHAIEDGRQRQDVPPVAAVPSADHELDIAMIPFHTRSTIDLNDPAVGPSEFELWIQTPPVSADLAPALTAYATDLTLIGTALRAVAGVDQRGNGTAFTSAVTSHTLWFHRPFNTDQWLLLRQHSPLIAHGRTFGRGDVLTEGGELVASYAQESLVRFRD